MSFTEDKIEIRDNGGRRAGIDRRYYSYSSHIPERRDGSDRRKLEDRRSQVKVIESAPDQHGFERRKAWNEMAC